MYRSIGAIALGLVVSACGGTMTVQTPYSTKEASVINNRGSATVTGQAFFRQRGGGVVTCAGNGVALVPATQYTQEFVAKAFGSVQGGAIPVIMTPQIEHPAEFSQYRRLAECDAEGDFEFRGIPNGDFYVFSQVTWQVGDNFIPEGGSLAKMVRIRGGQSTRVLLN